MTKVRHLLREKKHGFISYALANLKSSQGEDSLLDLADEILFDKFTFKGIKQKSPVAFHSLHGICYKFSNTDNETVSLPGTGGGLDMEMTLSSDVKIKDLKEMSQNGGHGVKMLVHERGQFLSEYEKGITLAPGFVHHVVLSKKMVKRFDRFSNGSCIPYNGHSNSAVSYCGHEYKFSPSICEMACVVKRQFADCGCHYYRYCAPYCTTLQQLQCIWTINWDDHNSTQCFNKCTQSCEETKYTLTSHFGKLLGEDAENKMRIVVYFQDFNFERIEHVFLNEWYTFLANIAANFVFWTGLNVMTVAEVIVFFSGLLMALLFSKHKKGEPLPVVPV